MSGRYDISERLLTAEEVAARLGVAPSWVLAQARARQIEHYRLRRQVRFSWQQIEAYLRAHVAPVRDHQSRGGTHISDTLPRALFPDSGRRPRGVRSSGNERSVNG